MFDPKKLFCFHLPFFSTLSFALIFLLIMYANTFISNFSIPSFVSKNRISHVLKNKIGLEKQKLSSKVEYHNHFQPPNNATNQERIALFVEMLPKLEIFKSTKQSRTFKAQVQDFLGNNRCKVQFFMTWISPVSSFGDRELFTIESLFKAHPKGCLVILSWSMDSAYGNSILKPFLDFGNKILAVTPDFSFLLENTPAESWFNQLKKGEIDPGNIPLAQNLSNLIRLAVLYKYGGVYLDTDFIILKDFSKLRNSIGAQSANLYGKWTRLNNAVLIFDKSHRLLYNFLEEFSFSFDGNKWGHNGPYLVSRVVERIPRNESYNFTILPPMVFYPIGCSKVKGLFEKPVTLSHSNWVEAKLVQIRESTFGVHLWNRKSCGMRIEKGSIVSRLISDNCVICKISSS